MGKIQSVLEASNGGLRCELNLAIVMTNLYTTVSQLPRKISIFLRTKLLLLSPFDFWYGFLAPITMVK